VAVLVILVEAVTVIVAVFVAVYSGLW
jgi:hypothetical protein